jgi:EmrB/QacA subfamily drug resistance transporter
MMKRVQYKYIVAAVFVIGLFMDLLDSTITNVSLPTLGKDFHASTTTIEWVVTGYLLSLAVFIPVSGWAGDRFGTKRTFMFALSVFTLSSFLCGFAWSIGSLVAFRVLQGVGGGMLTPVGTAMLYRAFPPSERARASSILTIPAVIAPASGPVLGGYLVEFHTWRWIFFMNIPVAIIGLLFSGRYLREHREETAGRLDIPGFLLSAGGLATLVYALSLAGNNGFGDSRVLIYGLAGIAMLIALVVVELRAPRPMLDIRLFRDKLFTAGNSVNFLNFAGMQGALFLLPLLLQMERGLSPLQSGLTTFPQAIGITLMSPFAGRIYGRLGPRRMAMIGLLFIAVTTAAFLFVDLETSQWWIRAIMLCRGCAMAFTFIPMQTATFATIRPQDTGRASATSNSIRQISASFGVALLGTVLASRLAGHGSVLGDPRTSHGALLAFHDAFFVASILALGGIAATLLIKDKLAVGTMRRAPNPAPEPVEESPLAVAAAGD